LSNTRIIILTILLLLLAVFAKPVEVQSIQVAPAETKVGIYPDITGSINVHKVNAPGEILEITVIAAVIRPDHVMKSWVWKNVSMKAGEVKHVHV
jgi:hypothetical protein